jgi:hypothetical protein
VLRFTAVGLHSGAQSYGRQIRPLLTLSPPRMPPLRHDQIGVWIVVSSGLVMESMHLEPLKPRDWQVLREAIKGAARFPPCLYVKLSAGVGTDRAGMAKNDRRIIPMDRCSYRELCNRTGAIHRRFRWRPRIANAECAALYRSALLRGSAGGRN